MRKLANEEMSCEPHGLLTLAKFEMKKRYVGAVRRIRKKTEVSKRRVGEILVKKDCKEGGVSL